MLWSRVSSCGEQRADQRRIDANFEQVVSFELFDRPGEPFVSDRHCSLCQINCV